MVGPRALRSLGFHFGQAHGLPLVHSVVQRAAADLETLGGLSVWSARRLGDVLGVGPNPVYAVLHEAIYCQGEASRWSAERAVGADPRFDPAARPAPYLTGEMIFPAMFSDVAALRGLRRTAEVLAGTDDWPPLYDLDRLRANPVPVVGTVYHDDLYVDRGFALETAALVGNCSPWLTNEYEHDAYRHDPARVFARLAALLDEKIPPAAG